MSLKRIAGWVLVAIGLLVLLSGGLQSVNERAKEQLEGRPSDLWREAGKASGSLCVCLLFLVPGIVLVRSGRSQRNPNNS